MAELEERQVVQQQVEGSAVTGTPTYQTTPAAGASSATVRRTSVAHRVSGNETLRRVVMLLFGIVQAAILLRFTFLLLDAREANGLVSAVLSFSQIFVGPFEGIFRTNALHSAGSVLELASITALIGITIIEALVLYVAKIVTRQPEGNIA